MRCLPFVKRRTEAEILSDVLRGEDGREELELARALRTRLAHQRVDATLRFVLDPIARVLRFGTRTVRLSQHEFAILDFLSRRSGMPVAAEALLKYAWGDSATSDRPRRTLDVHVCHLRRKLGQLGLQDAITTARRFGYMLGRIDHSSGVAGQRGAVPSV